MKYSSNKLHVPLVRGGVLDRLGVLFDQLLFLRPIQHRLVRLGKIDQVDFLVVRGTKHSAP